MKQIKVSTPGEEEYHDYSWIQTSSTQGPTQTSGTETGYQTPENYNADLDSDAQVKVLKLQLKDLRNQIKEIKRELKMHIANCPHSSIKVRE